MKLYSIVLPYLLLVSFATPNLTSFDINRINIINQSPYQGVAVPLIDAYDINKYSLENFSQSVNRINGYSKKQVWPWVFFNRFIGSKAGEKSHSPLANVPYFQRIKGVDLDNQSGALDDFYKVWQTSLRIAKLLQVPGIVVDAEAYNNYQNFKVPHVAQQQGMSQTEVINGLRAIGAALADIVAQEYPEAILWFFFTGLNSPYPTLNPATKEYRSVTYIIQGMLQRAKATQAKFTLVSGGEFSPGYCFKSLEDLQQSVARRNGRFLASLQEFPNLKLGATIAPWDRPEQKQDWLRGGKCGQSTLKGINDFQPLISHLLRSYNYVWIYAASAAGYNPYNPTVFPVYNEVLGAALNGEL